MTKFRWWLNWMDRSTNCLNIHQICLLATTTSSKIGKAFFLLFNRETVFCISPRKSFRKWYKIIAGSLDYVYWSWRRLYQIKNIFSFKSSHSFIFALNISQPVNISQLWNILQYFQNLSLWLVFQQNRPTIIGFPNKENLQSTTNSYQTHLSDSYENHCFLEKTLYIKIRGKLIH